ncbi:MAG: hypothetical protein FWG32_07610, partial [Oscillospiraceae bacterium]|nr:hypothetical protein [Oscillospiraceae bacterium]
MALAKEDLQAIRDLMREEIRAETVPINKRLNDVEESQRVIRDSQLRVELEQFPKINAALDGAAGNYDKNVEQDRRISSLEGKTEDHDKMIFALERAVKAK